MITGRWECWTPASVTGLTTEHQVHEARPGPTQQEEPRLNCCTDRRMNEWRRGRKQIQARPHLMIVNEFDPHPPRGPPSCFKAHLALHPSCSTANWKPSSSSSSSPDSPAINIPEANSRERSLTCGAFTAVEERTGSRAANRRLSDHRLIRNKSNFSDSRFSVSLPALWHDSTCSDILKTNWSIKWENNRPWQ